MSRQPFRVRSHAGPPAPAALLQRFLKGLAASGPAAPASTAAELRSLEALLHGAPPGLEDAELAGRLARVLLRAAGDPSLAALAAAAGGRASARPLWDRDRGVLWWAGVVVKRVRPDGANQRAVLDAFQAQGWPAFVADPLTHCRGIRVKTRLRQTIRSLNERLAGPFRFRAGGPLRGVLWEADA